MSAPDITYTITRNKISAVNGYDSINVKFSADEEYKTFQCRATKKGEDWGRGKGELLASFSSTPKDTERSFDIYDEYLVRGDGEYRIGLYVEGKDGSWNDTIGFIPLNSSGLLTADGKQFLCRKGDS